MINNANSGNLGAGLNSVTKILPVLSVARIGNVAQELASNAKNFVQGQLYEAKVLEKVSNTDFLVKVDQTLLKMALGNAGQIGQTLSLRYLQSQPTPTFLLSQPINQSSDEPVSVSQTAQLINNILKEANAEGATARYQATSVVTHHPQNPQVLAQDLKQAVNQTGLFYESHLKEFVQGERSLTALLQEPQNSHTTPLATLVSQQLNVLENQRFSWNGEVWQGQKMQLDVFQAPENINNERQSEGSEASEDRPMKSEMTLELPNLGKVRAQLSLINGRLKVALQAEQNNTLITLNRQKPKLALAIEKNGQALDALTVGDFSANRLQKNIAPS